MSLAATAAQQSSATAATSAASGTASGNALNSLSSNFNDFLKLLMTQLQNQDPTSPLDTNQFTSQLVQFASVEQQINANTNLGQLIQLTQGSQLLQGSSIVGKQVEVSSDHIPLQNGQGTLHYTSATAQPVAVAIYTDAGVKVRDASLAASAGANSWTWDGRDNNGNSVADGSYRIAVSGAAADGSAAALAFTVVGTATGVQKQGNAMQLQLGKLSTDFGSVQSVQ